MSFETYIHMEGDEITQLELSIDELVDAALGSVMHNALILMLIWIQ